MKKLISVFSLAALCILLVPGLCDNASAEQQLSAELNVYNWEDYFGPTTLKDFEKKFGVKVNSDAFADEEEMVANVQAHPEKYDVIIGSGDTIRDLNEMRLLTEINQKNIPNLKNIERKFRNPHYDPGNRHSVPYLWGTTGIVVNRAFIKGDIESWSILWDSKYKDRIAMLNNPEEVVGAALKLLGYSINATDFSKLEEARERLFEQQSLVAGYFDPITIRDKLISNEWWAAQEYSGEAMFACDKNKALEYIIPKEGAAVWIDCLAIPRDAKHKYTAEVFINYILEPKVSAKIANYNWYANCNIAARPFTLKEILKNPSLYPSEQILKRCEFFHPVGTVEENARGTETINKIWAELMLTLERKDRD